MQVVFHFIKCWLLVLLAIQVSNIFAQESQKEQTKKNPNAQHLLMPTSQQDTTKPLSGTSQRSLPKFDLPEYIITGAASVDLPKVEKVSFEDTATVPRKLVRVNGETRRDRETLELEAKNHTGNLQTLSGKYSGFAKAGLGSYFTPQAELQFGQSFTEYYYTLNGKYFLTNGFAPSTDRSKGSFNVSGGTIFESSVPLLNNAALSGALSYESETFHFYGSSTPNLQRSISNFNIQAKMENQAIDVFPYSAGVSVENLSVSDSSASHNETLLDLNMQTVFPITSLSIQTKLHWMSATGGLSFMDLSGGIQNYWFGGMMFEGSLHLYWGQGMAGQNLVRLRPHLLASYQMTTMHRIYVLYKPIVVPMTLASNIRINRFLSTASTIRHADVSDAGEIGVESDWNKAIRSRVSFKVESIRELGMFSDSSHKGIWTLTYGGKATIVTICAEMFAKLDSNDYFGSKILLRSTDDSFVSGKIPYASAIEAGFTANHKFGTTTIVSADVKFVGERKADLAGTSTLSRYAVVDVSGEYIPFDLLRFSVEINNLLGARYETWSGYREFPQTIHFSVQVKW